jgi:hypothetical protein
VGVVDPDLPLLNPRGDPPGQKVGIALHIGSEIEQSLGTVRQQAFDTFAQHRRCLLRTGRAAVVSACSCGDGKAERFIQTGLREWACARARQSSAEPVLAMTPWINAHNTQRPNPPIANRTPWLGLNNLLGNDTKQR